MAPYVRVLIRRPHAYDFLREHPELVPEEAVTRHDDGTVEVDGSRFPIPSICVLDSDGTLRSAVPLNASNARERLLDALRSERQ